MYLLQVVLIGLVNRNLDIDCCCVWWRQSVLVGAAGAAMDGGVAVMLGTNGFDCMVDFSLVDRSWSKMWQASI